MKVSNDKGRKNNQAVATKGDTQSNKVKTDSEQLEKRLFDHKVNYRTVEKLMLLHNGGHYENGSRYDDSYFSIEALRKRMGLVGDESNNMRLLHFNLEFERALNWQNRNRSLNKENRLRKNRFHHVEEVDQDRNSIKVIDQRELNGINQKEWRQEPIVYGNQSEQNPLPDKSESIKQNETAGKDSPGSASKKKVYVSKADKSVDASNVTIDKYMQTADAKQKESNNQQKTKKSVAMKQEQRSVSTNEKSTDLSKQVNDSSNAKKTVKKIGAGNKNANQQQLNIDGASTDSNVKSKSSSTNQVQKKSAFKKNIVKVNANQQEATLLGSPVNAVVVNPSELMKPSKKEDKTTVVRRDIKRSMTKNAVKSADKTAVNSSEQEQMSMVDVNAPANSTNNVGEKLARNNGKSQISFNESNRKADQIKQEIKFKPEEAIVSDPKFNSSIFDRSEDAHANAFEKENMPTILNEIAVSNRVPMRQNTSSGKFRKFWSTLVSSFRLARLNTLNKKWNRREK